MTQLINSAVNVQLAKAMCEVNVLIALQSDEQYSLRILCDIIVNCLSHENTHRYITCGLPILKKLIIIKIEGLNNQQIVLFGIQFSNQL